MISAVLFNARKKHEDKLEQNLARTEPELTDQSQEEK